MASRESSLAALLPLFIGVLRCFWWRFSRRYTIRVQLGQCIFDVFYFLWNVLFSMDDKWISLFGETYTLCVEYFVNVCNNAALLVCDPVRRKHETGDQLWYPTLCFLWRDWVCFSVHGGFVLYFSRVPV